MQTTANPRIIPHILIEEPSTAHHLAQAKALLFSRPKESDLSPSIRAGKQLLDAQTEFSIVALPDDVGDYPVAELSDGRYLIPKSKPLPLRGPYSRRKIDGSHLWVEIESGHMIVLDYESDELMSRLCQAPPLKEIPQTSGLASLIGILARAGFIRGIRGNVDRTVVDAKRFLRIHLTERCNLSCIHCYTDSSPSASIAGELSPDRWIDIITDFKDMGGERVLFTGGEALAYAGCDHLLRHSKQLDLHVTLFTNGILVPKYLEAICESVSEVQISIDGASAISNDPIRGNGSFKKAIKAIDLLAARGIAVRVSTVAMKDNWDDIKEHNLALASRWDKLPVTFKLNYGVMTHGRGETLEDELEINETRPIVDSIMQSLYPTDSIRIVRSTTSCGYAEQIVVAPNGEVHPCHLLSGAIANLGDGSIETALTAIGDAHREFSVDTSIGCKTCDIRHLCGGTCRIENGKKTGNLRVTYCDADEKHRKLVALKRTFS
jgi:radical SAM protein with 4Fe4S-binding SPASM domain